MHQSFKGPPGSYHELYLPSLSPQERGFTTARFSLLPCVSAFARASFSPFRSSFQVFMAPKRRGRPRKTVQPADEDSEKQETSASAEQTIASEEAAEDDDEKADTEPSPKKTKVEEKKTRGRKPKANRKKAAAARKKAAVHEDERESDEEEESEEEVKEEAPANAKSVKVILIEASKECNCFKTRAAKVHAGLTKAIPGIEVQINPDKPRKGCFEVRGQDGTIYLSLLGLPRPFTKLKKLDMDEAIEDIVAKVK